MISVFTWYVSYDLSAEKIFAQQNDPTKISKATVKNSRRCAKQMRQVGLTITLRPCWNSFIAKRSCARVLLAAAKWSQMRNTYRYWTKWDSYFEASLCGTREGTHGTQVTFVPYVSGLRSIPGGSRQNRTNVLVTRTRFETETGNIDTVKCPGNTRIPLHPFKSFTNWPLRRPLLPLMCIISRNIVRNT